MQLPRIRPFAKCADGFTISVQASTFHCCSPRANGLSEYDTVEVGYPSAPTHELDPYKYDKHRKGCQVYDHVPFSLIQSILDQHGGIVTADTSNDQSGFWQEVFKHD
jgi:hypothetical protein